MKKTAYKLCLAVLFTLILFTIVFTASAEAGGEFATAQKINVNEIYADNINSSDDVDYFTFMLSSPGCIHLEFSRDNLYDSAEYWTVAIYDENSNYVAEYSFSGNETETITYNLGLDSGTYFLRIRCGAWNSRPRRYSTTDYNFNIKYKKSDYWEKENNNDNFNTANDIVLNKKYTASICQDDDEDYFSFAISSPGCVSLEFSRDNLYNSAEYWTVAIYDEKSNYVAEYSFPGNETETITYNLGLDSGTYFLRIRCGAWNSRPRRYSTTDYNFNIKYKKSDYWEKENNNDNFNTANDIVLNKKYTASICQDNDEDFYRFILREKSSVTINFFENVNVNNLEYYSVTLYDSSTKEIDYFQVFGNSSTIKENVTLDKGTYFIRIRCGEWNSRPRSFTTDDYIISVDYTEPAKPSKITTSSSAYSIKLSWNKVSGATGYRIYKYNSKTKKYKALKTLSGTSYTMKNLNLGTSYKFKIKAYKKINDETIWGDASSVITVKTKLGIPNKITASQTTTTITLKWNEVIGADSYRVYKYNTKSKKYEKFKDVVDTSLKISNLKAGTTYKYKIRAYTKNKNTIWGDYSKVFKTATKCKAPYITRINSSNKGVASLVWSNVGGESGYQVYYSTKKDDDFKKVAIYKANVTKYSNKKLKSGKKYYFKVRAYKTVDGKKIYGAWSAVKSIKVK